MSDVVRMAAIQMVSTPRVEENKLTVERLVRGAAAEGDIGCIARVFSDDWCNRRSKAGDSGDILWRPIAIDAVTAGARIKYLAGWGIDPDGGVG